MNVSRSPKLRHGSPPPPCAPGASCRRRTIVAQHDVEGAGKVVGEGAAGAGVHEGQEEGQQQQSEEQQPQRESQPAHTLQQAGFLQQHQQRSAHATLGLC